VPKATVRKNCSCVPVGQLEFFAMSLCKLS